jgi:DUF2914 family protein
MPSLESLLPLPSPLRRYVPAAFFIGGFIWDAFTIGRSITPFDLFTLLAYLSGSAAILVALGRGVTFRGSDYLNAVLQFFFGNIFSALFIFYFLSSSSLSEYAIVLGLAALLLGNEFLESAYSELTLSWSFFTLSAIMFFNFALAHLFHSINTFWFYLGTLLALLLVLALRQTSRKETASIKPSIALAVVMLALHALNIIPPVPLVKKQMLVAHAMRKTSAGYLAQVESPGWRFWRTSAPVFHRQGREKVYCFTSVFIPNGITTTIHHRWELYDEENGEWRTTGIVPFRIEGGRQTGYRGLTWKQNLVPGLWRVTAESESGAAIGMVEFRVEAGTPARLKNVRL